MILMAPEDIARHGFAENDRVRVASAAGVMDGMLVRAFAIKPGNALMYYPEANVLVPRGVDPKSRTPAFKAVPITVARSSAPARGGAAKAVKASGMASTVGFFLRKRRRPKLNAC